MQVTQTRADGLSRELKVVVPAATLDARLTAYLDDLGRKVSLKGFRPGKVPMAHLRRMYGRTAMAEVVNDVMNESVKDAVSTRDEKPALQPDVDVDQDSLREAIEGKSDLLFAVKYEVLPEFEVSGLETIAVERPVYRVPDDEVEEELKKLAERSSDFEAADRPAASGDRLKIDFVGKIDGKAFDGGSAEGIDIVIGQGRFIPGFEEQLVGASAGDARVVSVSFPADYPAQTLAGKAAEFAVTVHEVAAAKETVLDDAFAERLGMETVEKLRDALRGQMQSSFDRAIRQRMKRSLLDALDARFAFDLPQKLVESEFTAIWNQVERDMAERKETFDTSLAEDAEGSEAKTRADYRAIAERRVRLGLLLSEVGTRAAVEVKEEEVNRALSERLRQFPGREREVLDYYRRTPQAAAALRAPIFEDKVIDYILELAQVTEVPISKEELLKEAAEEEPGDHDHDHDHGHDHAHHAHDHGHEHHDHAHDHAHGDEQRNHDHAHGQRHHG